MFLNSRYSLVGNRIIQIKNINRDKSALFCKILPNKIFNFKCNKDAEEEKITFWFFIVRMILKILNYRR